MTHIDINQDLLPLVGRKEQVLDGITGFVEYYDFSKANSSYEARVQAVTKVASVCYGNPKALGSISLFDRLQAESHGLPSSSYEFVPVLLKMDATWLASRSTHMQNLDRYQFRKMLYIKFHNSIKFGEYICDSEETTYLLTNLRALIADVGVEESLNYLNTDPVEIQIIRDNFKVFLFNVDLSTRAQMVRHRVSWQELSRRYVSGKKQPFEFYISEKMSHVNLCDPSKNVLIRTSDGELDDISFSVHNVINICTDFYNQAIASGIKPEEARRILPQAMMTTIWGAFQPTQLDNFFQLRLHKSAQSEIRQVAEAMEALI